MTVDTARAIPGATTGDVLPGSSSSRRSCGVRATGDPASVLSPENVEEAYGIGVDVIEHAHRRLLVPAD